MNRIAQHLDVRPATRAVTALFLIGLMLSLGLLGSAWWLTNESPRISIPGTREVRDISPAEFGPRHIEGFASNWVLRINNSHAVNYLAHAATALPDADPAIHEDLKAFFRKQNTFYNALDRTTTAEIDYLKATVEARDLWRCEYRVVMHTWYGAIDTGSSTQEGNIWVRVHSSGETPIQIAAFEPGKEISTVTNPTAQGKSP